MLVLFSSVAQSCPTLGNPMNCSTPGLPVHHQLLEFTQTHVQYLKKEDTSVHVCSVVSNTFATPWTVARQVPLSVGFPRQEY